MLENQQGRYLYEDPLYGGGKRSGGLAPGFVGEYRNGNKNNNFIIGVHESKFIRA